MSLCYLEENKLDKHNYKYIDVNNINNRNIQSKPLFNSKLFLYIDINQDENIENNTKEDSDNSFEFDEINYLSNELIQDLNNFSYIEEKESITKYNKKENENIIKNNIVINSLISLAKNGYEFKPKNYKSEDIYNDNLKKGKNIDDKKYMSNKFNKNKFIKKKRDKNDWICPLCDNLNYAFRKICNKCKSSKNEN